MSISSISRFLQFVLPSSLVLYYLVEFVFQKELMIILVCIASILVIVDTVRFGIKEKGSIELGEKYDFRKSPIFRIMLPIVLIGLIFMIWKLGEWNWFPDDIERSEVEPFFPLIIMIPQFLDGISWMIYGRHRTIYYATEKGMIISLRGDEVKEWNDFYKYTILEEQDIIKFQKKNLKYLSIQYNDEYFHKYRKEIVSFLDQKLTRV